MTDHEEPVPSCPRERRTGANGLAIPHNANLSNALMFSVETNDGKLPPVGNTADVENATSTNTIGAPELIAVWKDPEFDPNQNALTVPGLSRSRPRAGPPTK